MPRCQVRLLGAPPGGASHVIPRRRSLAKTRVRWPCCVLRAAGGCIGCLFAGVAGC
jgi:hypothetical protein